MYDQTRIMLSFSQLKLLTPALSPPAGIGRELEKGL